MKVVKNPDDVFVRNQRKRIKGNNGYCCCKLEKKPENKCPCKDFREGRGCDCGQYINVPEEEDDEC